MRLNFGNLLYAFSYGLDCVESQLVQVEAGHGKRVAAFCIMLGRYLGFTPRVLEELGYLAAMHDNALTEYLKEEKVQGEKVKKTMEGKGFIKHCVLGEANIASLPIDSTLKNAILYHHEEADGRGPFGKTAEETPLAAQLIHMADVIDIEFGLSDMEKDKFTAICNYLEHNRNIRFSDACVDLFLNQVDLSLLSSLNIMDFRREFTSECVKEYSNRQIKSFCDLWIKIIDYKSEFTSRHSRGVSRLAEKMGKVYGFDEDKCTALYFAGAIHDIGKLTTDSRILEKAGKLTEQEYELIKNHAYQSWYILKDIRGLEEITCWAVHHHEKLNGKGYPFGKTGEELCFEERLMACIDIYQALTEDRPYKKGLSHEETIGIMRGMVSDGFIDGHITEKMYESLKQ